MTMTKTEMAAVFNEWAKRYAAEPEKFGAVLDANGKPIADYGENAAHYFEQVAADMQTAGLIPPAPASAA